MHIRTPPAAPVVLGLIALYGCGESTDPSAPDPSNTVGSVQVTVATELATAESLHDPDGYVVRAGDPALFETHEEFVARHDALAALSADARHAAESGFSRLVALKYSPEIPQGDPKEVISDSRALLKTLHQGFAA